MKNLWNDEEASQFQGDLAQRVYTSRLLGRDKSLVLHGGGNTSVKITEQDILGNEESILYVKGSGYDLETIVEEGFSPVRMQRLLDLAKLENLSDPEMVNELRTHMTRADAPTPSVEAILHAILPYKYVDHTHANFIVATTNAQCGYERIKELYEDMVVIIPYIMPGFDLAKLCAEKFAAEANESTIGMVLMNHGIFSFGETAKISYDRMIKMVSMVEQDASDFGATDVPIFGKPPKDRPKRLEIAELRRDISACARIPMIVESHMDELSYEFIQQENVAQLSQQGPATPDHVIRTKRLPMLGRDVDAYAQAYKAYFDEYAPAAKQQVTMLDPAPRVVLDPELGMCAVGRSAKDASVVGDIYYHTMNIIRTSNALGGYHALAAKDIFDVEYWDLEQAKLRKGGAPPPFTGEIAVVTGAASGIGKACVDSLMKRGAAVIALDINKEVETLYDNQSYRGFICDVSDGNKVAESLEAGVRAFGGIDILILNAGIFPESQSIASLDMDYWHKVMNINLDANLGLMKEAHPLLKLAPQGGRVVIIGSKNVAAPGPGAAAYSSSKAALNQLARVAALEWADDNIRINTLHPDCVFDTGIWTDEILASRAARYGLTVEEYKKKNLLGLEVTSPDVAELAAEMCGSLFGKTTGAQLPVDGGNVRVI